MKVNFFLILIFNSVAFSQACPNITLPTPDTINVAITTDITWTAVQGAIGYYVLIGTTPGGRDIIDREDVGNNTKYELPEGDTYPANTLISVKITIRFENMPDQTCPYILFTTGDATSQEDCGHFINPIPDFVGCDSDNDGIVQFDIDSAILESQLIGDQNNLRISFYKESNDPFIFNTDNQLVNEEITVVARATNTLGCFKETSFRLIVEPIPEIQFFEDISDCSRFVLPELNGNNNYFTAANGEGIQLSAGDILTQTQRIFVYAALGDCSNQSDFVVNIDSLLCEEEKNICVATFPNYFTPNNDGFHDRFQIIENNCPINGEVYIYDRYGRFIKQFRALDGSWDGNTDGVDVLETDYWYKFIDSSNGIIVTGHFSLKR